MDPDVLKPALLWIGKRCYRKVPLSQSVEISPDTEDLYPGEYQKPYEERHGITIKHQNNKFHNVVLAPALLEGELRRMSNNLMRKTLKSERVEISVPHSANSSGSLEITISGPTERGVYEASRKIEEALEIAHLKSSPTHFVSIPMNSNAIRNSFLEFRASVLKTCKGARGLHEDLFQDPYKLHMTIIMLKLMNSYECESAIATLKSCKEDIAEMLYDTPLAVMVKGIEIMNDDPEEVDVLYAKIESDEDGSIQRIADYLLKKFSEAKLSSKLESTVKLHITLMNSKFCREAGKEREKFDATAILEQYSNFKFGRVILSEVHVSTLGGTGEDGYYMPLSCITIDSKRMHE